jgi:hypothetical protein
VLATIWAAGAAWVGQRTYDDSVEHGSAKSSAAVWIIVGLAATVFLIAVVTGQARRWGQGERRASSGLYRLTLAAVVALGGTSILSGLAFTLSHGAWRLGVVAFTGSVFPALAVALLWLSTTLPPPPAND